MKKETCIFIHGLTEYDEVIAHGEPGEKPITSGQAAVFIIQELANLKLEPPADINWILIENRRNPFSPSAMKTGIRRGNRGRWGYLPYIRFSKSRVGYYRSQVRTWMNESLIPQCQQREAA